MNVVGIDHIGYSILKQQKPPPSEKEIWNMLQYAAIHLRMKDGTYIFPGVEIPTPTSSTISSNCDTVYIYRDRFVNMPYQTTDSPTSPDSPDSRKSRKSPFHLALKTNLLYDAALLPNLTAELYLGKQWSLAIEGNWSWWTFAGKKIQNNGYHRVQAAGAELRRWIKSPSPLQGHAVGLYYMLGDYDLRLFPKNENSTGQLSYSSRSAGLSYAYSMPLNRRLNLEFGIAFGYAGGRYYVYDYCMSENWWEQQEVFNRTYWGPTRVGISLVWLPFSKKGSIKK
jgi:hypothetical protein